MIYVPSKGEKVKFNPSLYRKINFVKEVQELYTVNDKTLQSGNLRQGSGIIYSIHTYRLHCSGLVWASLPPTVARVRGACLKKVNKTVRKLKG